MADVTQELMFEMLRKIQADISGLKEGQREIKAEIGAVVGTLIFIQQDINNIYGIPGRHDHSLDRIETRLDIREFAEPPQRPFDTNG